MESDATLGALPAPVREPPESDLGSTIIDPGEETTGLFGNSHRLRRLRKTIAIYARSTAVVVIHGETGTGKELVARALHGLGRRAMAPFVAANVAVLPESISASELFGHERGAFTGAIARHRGLFEQADRGTLFLDEVAELTPDNQARLLRALETGEIRPVGSERSRTVSVRLVAATHTPLAPLVAAGLFREDLFYRLQTLVITIPALRERIEDLPRIAEHLLDRLTPENGRRRLTSSAVMRLQSYGWPGNIRQLANVLRRASVRTPGSELHEDVIAEALADEPRARALVREGASIETIRAVLRQYGGRISPSARQLGMARSTLRERIRRYSITLDS